MLRNIVGPPARGDDFFDREETVELLWERLASGNVLLAAPRRFGKTSLMYRLIDKPRDGWKPIHVDAESIREPVNFVIALLEALMKDQHIRKFLESAWEHASEWLRGFELSIPIDMTTPSGPSFKIGLKERMGEQWRERGEALLHTLQDYTKKLLIIIDELPVMLQLFQDNEVSDAETRAFLYWFRRLRTDPQVGLTNCRFLIGGSIGIENHLSRLGVVDSFNDFERVPVRELSEKRAAEFLEKLLASRGLQLSDATQRKILQLIGTPIPYFIQVFVAEIANEQHKGVERIGPQRLETLYHERLLGATCKTYFQHYYDRLRDYDKPQERAAKALLKGLALSPPGVHESQLRAIYRRELGEGATGDDFARLLGDLENDFYIHYRHTDKTYAFASKILCDWWRRYYAF